MFYLIEFSKSLGESLGKGFAFFFFSCLFAFSLTHRPWIARSLEKITPEKMVNPYFVTVLDQEASPEKIRLAAAELPGVMGVTSIEAEGKRKLQGLIRDLGPDYAVGAELMDFKSLRIVLSPNLSAESLDFIRKEIIERGGRDHVTATEIKYPEVTSVMNAHPFYRWLGRAGDWGVVVLFGLFWIASYWLSFDLFRSRSYLIEKFQRRRFVAAKTYATGLAGVMLLFGGLGLLNGTLKVFDLILLFMVFSVCWTFSLQDWRWRPSL